MNRREFNKRLLCSSALALFHLPTVDAKSERFYSMDYYTWMHEVVGWGSVDADYAHIRPYDVSKDFQGVRHILPTRDYGRMPEVYEHDMAYDIQRTVRKSDRWRVYIRKRLCRDPSDSSGVRAIIVWDWRYFGKASLPSPVSCKEIDWIMIP